MQSPLHPRPLRQIIMGAIFGMALLMPATLAAEPIIIEGDGWIECALVVLNFRSGCDLHFADEGNIEFDSRDRFRQRVGSVQSVELTISWVATNVDAEELRLHISSDSGECWRAGEPLWCDSNETRGRSPLTASLGMLAASNATIYADVSPLDGCDSSLLLGLPELSTCRTPPVVVVREQPFHYTWVIHPN